MEVSGQLEAQAAVLPKKEPMGCKAGCHQNQSGRYMRAKNHLFSANQTFFGQDYSCEF
jgi:hypothetical protein